MREGEPKENQKKVIFKTNYGDPVKKNRHVQDLKANQICKIGNERRWIRVDRPTRSRSVISRVAMGIGSILN